MTTPFTLNIGGLFAAGFDSSGKYLLAVSHAGRGVFEVGSWKRVARDEEIVYPIDGCVVGIGPIDGMRIPIVEKNYDTDELCWTSPDGTLRFEYEYGLVEILPATAPRKKCVVETWFGERFAELHPLLQELHRAGGVLRGRVEVSFGSGIAGFIGKRLARRLDVPATPGMHELRVWVLNGADVLVWLRRFDNHTEFRSEFRPVGRYPDGHWVEKSGPLRMELGVQLIDGGWHWQHRSTSWSGKRVPKFLLPATAGSKRIEDGRYCFSVEVGVPILGKLLAYSGKLSPNAAIEHVPARTEDRP